MSTMQAVHRPVNMDIESPPHIPGPINGNPYAVVNQAMKMKCRADSEDGAMDSDYPGESKMAKYNGNSNIFQFPVVIGEQQIRDENRKAAMNELLGNLGVNSASLANGDTTTTVTITTTKHATHNPQPPQRQSSFKATKNIKMKKAKAPQKAAPTSPVQVALVQTAPSEDQNLYYASHYAASQPGKVKAKLHVDPHSGGQISPTASPELIANRKMLLDVIEGGDDSGSGDDLDVVPEREVGEQDSDSESEEEISYHESPTLPRRGNVASKVQFLSKTMAFSPPPDSDEQNKRKNTSVPLIGLTCLAATDITDRIAKHNEKSLAAGQVMSTANMVLYSSKQPPKKVVEFNPDSHEHRDDEAEDFRIVPVLRHHQDGWNKVETNDSDTSDVHSDKAIEEDFPPPPPPTPPPPVVQTIKLGQQAEFRLNVQVSSAGQLEPVHESSDIHAADSGCEDASTPVSPPPGIKIEEPAIQKELMQVEESVDDELLEELFRDEAQSDVRPSKTRDQSVREASQPVSKPQRKAESKTASKPVTVVIKRVDSEERRDADEDEAGGYSRIEDIKPGKGQEDVPMKDVDGMTDEEFLNSYKVIPDKKLDIEVSPTTSPTTSPTETMKKSKLSPAERGPAVLNELINGIRTMKQEMSYKAKQADSVESDVFPTSPTSDKSSSSLSPTSTLSRGKRKHRKASDKGYGSTNSSLSESELFVEIPKNPSVKFDKDTSAFWYKPHITREQAIALLQDKAPGTFVIRDSQSYTGAFGLAIKVEVPPMHVIQGQNKDFDNIDPSEFVRHLLIESTPKGVHLKDCKDEPLFGSLAAFVYQHSLTEISLPCKLVLPTKDLTVGTLKITDRQETETQLLAQGAACNVAYLGSFNVESLTGPAALKYAVAKIEPGRKNKEHEPVLVNFKVNKQGITLTDNDRKLFFRKHYPLKNVLYWGTDPDDTRWDLTEYGGGNLARSFVFVSRKVDSDGNECHLFAEMDPKQPASTVVDVITKIISNVNS